MRFATVLLGVSLLAAGATRTAPAATTRATPALATLLAEIRRASGSPYLAHVESRSRERIGGVAYDVTSESEGSRYLIRRCAGDVCNGLFIDGERSSTVNINDTALPLPIDVDPLQSSLRAVATDAFAAPAFTEAGGRVEQRTSTTADGRPVDRLVVATAHGAALEVAIDARTHLVRTVASQNGGVAFGFTDYRRVDGLTLPFEIDVDGKRNQRFDSRRRVAGALEPPAGLTPAMPSASSVALRPGIAPIADCALAGIATTCLVDTGNSGMAISAQLAARLHLRVEGAAAHGLARAIDGVAHAGALRIGSATYSPAIYVVVRDLRASGADVALGADFFAHTRVTLDAARHRLRIAPSARLAHGLPITFENFEPITGAALGSVVAPVVLDSGTTDGVVVPLALLKANPTIASGATVPAASGARRGAVAALRLDNTIVSSAPLLATPLLVDAARPRIGGAVLRHLVIDLDYAHQTIDLTPAPGDPAARKAG